MSGLLSGAGGQAQSSGSAGGMAQQAPTYYTGSSAPQSFGQYLSNIDKQKLFSDLGKSGLTKSHTQSGTSEAPQLVAAADAPPPVPVQSVGTPQTQFGQEFRSEVRKGLVNRLLGAVSGG